MSRTISRRYALFIIGAASLTLAGCGRKADPKPPPDADPRAPRVYPVDRSAPPGTQTPAAPPEESPFQQRPLLPVPDPLAPVPPSPGIR